MFPPALPRYFIEQCSRPGDSVYDPFCGRGTVPLEACIAGRYGIGSDANPLAIALTRAKVNAPNLYSVRERIHELRSQYRRSDITNGAPADIKLLFDGRRTLPQLLFLKERLSRRRYVDNFLIATLCGILHGNHTSQPSESRTLSISMPNTFSMSPGYIRRYVRQNHLRKYPFDVFDSLARRCEYLFRDPVPEVSGRAFSADARACRKYVADSSVDLIVTSPPYLRVIRYGKYNWIRLWLLGEAVETVDQRLMVERTDNRLRLSDQLTLHNYCAFMTNVIHQLERVLRPGGTCVMVIGDVPGITAVEPDLNLAETVWRTAVQSSKLRLTDIVTDSIEVSRKVTRIWGGKKGRATKTDRILVMRKAGTLRRRAGSASAIVRRLISDTVHGS
jgi:SAM-dependent methyltransferase